MAGVLNQGYVYREQIGAGGEGQTVLAYLVRHHTHSSEEVWRSRLAAGQVRLEERVAAAGDLLRRGDWLVWHRPPWEELEVPLSFEVLYEDADILAVAKPSGLPTVPGGGFLEHTLLALVTRRAPEAAPMHRLGRGTSGIVLFARTPDARRRLQEAWRKHRVDKVYRTLASGTAAERSFVIEQPIGEVAHPVLGTIFAAAPDGKPSRSHVTVLEQRPDAFLADVQIETGRPHQIRIHLAAAGHPLVGDPLYVAGGAPTQDSRALPGDAGYWLHARLLAFVHPATGERMVIECEPPTELRPSAHRS